MSERKYSVSEIERMRRAITWSYPSNVCYVPQERSAEIENRLRTYMQNGTEPEELEESAHQQAAYEQQARRNTTAQTPVPRVPHTDETPNKTRGE